VAVLTSRKDIEPIFEEFRSRGACMAVFCTASCWNTEAILLAAKRFGEKHNISRPIVSVATTFNYPFMPQCQRVTYSGDARAGFISIMEHLNVLAASDDAPYNNVIVLPHLDHADPKLDNWALTEGVKYLATVMFDAQKYPAEENLRMTTDYVRAYADRVMIEGIVEQLSVEGRAKGAVQHDQDAGAARDDYVDRATDYMERTDVDFLVADLGTEQQSVRVGEAEYLKDRARALTEALGTARLVLHGTSCLSPEQMDGLAEDGIIRVNTWTRIVREAGQFAAEEVVGNIGSIRSGEFEFADPRAFIRNATDKAALVMEELMEIIGYARFAE
jgi:fructose/tagatose bisphosphate aldolase